MTGEIYFVHSGDSIKIGFSKTPEHRVRALATASPRPMDLLVTVAGSQKFERAIHAHLAPHRLNGEWFFDCPQVRDAIAEIVRLGPQAIGFQDSPARPHGPKPELTEYSAALKRLAEPLAFGDSVKEAISRAAERAGLSYWRAFDIWYLMARRVDAHEAAAIERASA